MKTMENKKNNSTMKNINIILFIVLFYNCRQKNAFEKENLFFKNNQPIKNEISLNQNKTKDKLQLLFSGDLIQLSCNIKKQKDSYYILWNKGKINAKYYMIKDTFSEVNSLNKYLGHYVDVLLRKKNDTAYVNFRSLDSRKAKPSTELKFKYNLNLDKFYMLEIIKFNKTVLISNQDSFFYKIVYWNKDLNYL
jgi:hypothetical protein